VARVRSAGRIDAVSVQRHNVWRIRCTSNEDRLTAAPSALPLRRFIQLSVLQASAAVPSSADGRRDQIGGARVDQDTVQRRVRLDLTAMLLGSQQGDHLIA